MCSWKWLTVSQYKLSKRTNTKNMLYSFENCSLTHFANNCIVTEPLRQFSTVGESPGIPLKVPDKTLGLGNYNYTFIIQGQRTQRIEGGRGWEMMGKGSVKGTWNTLEPNWLLITKCRGHWPLIEYHGRYAGISACQSVNLYTLTRTRENNTELTTCTAAVHNWATANLQSPPPAAWQQNRIRKKNTITQWSGLLY